MKNLFIISGVFAATLLFSCGQSNKEKELTQKLDVLQHHDDSIKQDAAIKKAATRLKQQQADRTRKIQADKQELEQYNADMVVAQQQLNELQMPKFLRTHAEKDAETKQQTLKIESLQDSINTLQNRIILDAGNCTVWTPYNVYISVYVDGNLIGSTQGAGISNGISTIVDPSISHKVTGSTTATFTKNGMVQNGENWSGATGTFPNNQKLEYELQ